MTQHELRISPPEPIRGGRKAATGGNRHGRDTGCSRKSRGIDALLRRYAPAPDLVSNGHATNIRDDIAALINEGTGLVDAAFSARISEEDRA